MALTKEEYEAAFNEGYAEATAWKSIDTAPRNEPVLFYDEEWEATLGAIQIGSIDDDGSGRTAETDQFHPTHWMPIPPAPTAGQE